MLIKMNSNNFSFLKIKSYQINKLSTEITIKNKPNDKKAYKKANFN